VDLSEIINQQDPDKQSKKEIPENKEYNESGKLRFIQESDLPGKIGKIYIGYKNSAQQTDKKQSVCLGELFNHLHGNYSS
jgi:hypothetical protein